MVRGSAKARPRANPSSGTARPCSANAAGQISDVRDEGVARSARTRRSVTRGRLEVRRSENGIVGRRDVVQYRVESVRHDTSPSCRDRSRQGPACPEDTRSRKRFRRGCPPHVLAVRPASLRTCRGSFETSLLCASRQRDEIPLGDIQTKSYRSHIAMGFDPTIAF